MKKHFAALTLLSAAAFLASCGNASGPTAARNSNAAGSNNAQTSIQHGTSPSTNLGAASSHGGGAAPATDTASDRALVDTKELDARIKAASEKAKAPNASAADKKAAADAYFERGNVYWNGGQPRLYKFALADFKQVLKYDPSNEDAKKKIDTIVGIYQGMGRPVPEVPDEQ